MLVDTHAHLNMLDNAEAAVQNAAAAGVGKIIVPATGMDDLAQVVDLAQKYENVYGILGIHPTDVGVNELDEGEISRLAVGEPKIVGIGEIGLDYYHDKSFIDAQKDVFIRLIKLANKLNLPINVHDREAHEDTFEILQGVNQGSKVIMHCFSGDLGFAQKCVAAGYYIGIGGVVTFKNARALKEVAAKIPLESIVLETDAPFLAPVPHRGEKNEPAYVKFVAEEIANLRGVSFDEVARVTTQNVEEIFKI
jgi:TatD DNase family protein